MSDGYIFTGYNNSNHAISFYKFDKQGNLLWGGRKTSDIIGTPLPLHKKNNGNLVGIFSKNTITMIIEFDKDLNVVAQSSIYNSTLFGKDLCFLSDGTPVLAGLGIMNPVFAKLDHSYHSKCDAVSDVVNFISEPASANFINNIVSTTNLNVVTKNYLTDTVAVSVVTLCNTPKVLDIGNDTLLCKGTTMILQNHNNDLFDHYQWSTGETSPAISINEPGTYWLLVNDDCNVNDLNDTVWIKIKPAVEADLGADVLLCEKAMLQFYAPVCDSCLFEWSTGSQADSIEVKEQGSYWLSVKNNNGCTSTDTVEVSIVKCECELYIPNAFTPNEDGLNELFNPVYDCDVADYTLKIINRWGELVYTTNNITAGWTGMFNNRTVLSGIYIYVITYRPLIKGKPNDRIVKRGTVAVIY